MKNKILILSFFLLFWILIYLNLNALTDFLVYSIIGLEKNTHLTNAIWFFIYEVPKVLLLLILIVFAVGIIRSHISHLKEQEKCLAENHFLPEMYWQVHLEL